MTAERTHEMLRAADVRLHLPQALRCAELCCLEEVDSTNTRLKEAALEGAAAPMVVIAHRQTAGRGRRGRNFLSPEGKGLYLSVLLRPGCEAGRLMCVTGMAAVAVCRAVERAGGARPRIKWVNDLVLGNKKFCGILAETVMTESGPALVLGVGINVYRDEFTPEVAALATSLEAEGFSVSRAALAAAVMEELLALEGALAGDLSGWVSAYRARCVNIGRDVRLMWDEGCRRARCLDVDGQFGLVVRYADGGEATVRTGEVSVRGLYGYVE